MKKQTTKKLTSILLSMTFITSFSGAVMNPAYIIYADENSEQVIASILQDEGFGSCVNALLSTSADMGITGNMYEAYIGSPFNIYRIDSEMNITLNTNSYYFPVIYNNDICALITAKEYEDCFSFSCGLSFADVLDTSLLNSNNYSIISDENGNIYLANSNGELSTLRITDNPMHLDTNANLYNVLQFELSNEIINTKTADFSEWYSNTRSTGTQYYCLPSYPSVIQSGPTCWAYTIHSMGLYLGETSMIEQVFSAAYISNGVNITGGATTAQAFNTICYIFNSYMPTRKDRQLTGSEILHYIQNGLPVYISGYRTTTSGESVGHACALIGYHTYNDNVLGFFVMNPQGGTIMYNVYSASDCTFDRYESEDVYLWNRSISLIP